jgi:hypothetical protein
MNGLGLYIVSVALPIMFGLITLMRLEYKRAQRWTTLYFFLSMFITGTYVLVSFLAGQLGDTIYGIIFYIAMLCFLVQAVTLLAVKKSNLKRVLSVNLVSFTVVSAVLLEYVLVRAL